EKIIGALQRILTCESDPSVDTGRYTWGSVRAKPANGELRAILAIRLHADDGGTGKAGALFAGRRSGLSSRAHPSPSRACLSACDIRALLKGALIAKASLRNR